MNEDLWPTEIRLSADRRVLNVAFEDGARFALPAEYLRVSSPSAEVQGHSPLERKVIGGKRAVAILAVDPIGNYAVKLGFDDMHDTGIYGWEYLHILGREYESRWQTYLTELAERGLDRETARTAPVKQTGGCGSGSCGCH
ncbi:MULTISPECIES: DUF971 domain-containing protein [unclassified Methylobacterium]|uniref:gamma-butyrobetaine hydroxylase-like domain-containing protein n=1 Tax=unclassified Methylobacterium TaxID=2615210 RepID=UPI0011C1E6D6|nr:MULTISPECIES: DUF971 domain-containing protein [unclassified Methylobacterium]QEE41918.1 DUF971 domain-containing protein [Methylobacterium sp. WL1]RZK82885.1 MAG: DUF971 domain-containing protein [Methylobacterium sp.]TXN02324.1 DUF971 domain-containing protein [Methylobacterium sp. WL64]TXN54810.1 DUF971 domain-containing protein [Methylobacterium sp. WL2]